jgi:hypothetical protein
MRLRSISIIREIERVQRLIIFAVLLIVGCVRERGGTIPVQLLSHLEFGDGKVGSVTQSSLPNLFNRKVSLGGESNGYDFLVMPSSEHRLQVETVNQYLAALKNGAYPLTTFDITMDSWFLTAAGTLKFLERATPSRKSLLPDSLVHLPSSVVFDRDQNAQEDQAAAGIKDLVKAGKVKNLKTGKHHIQFETDSEQIVIKELARGDFDGDGFEDGLVLVASYAIEGSGRGYSLFIIHRTAIDRQVTCEEFTF